MKNENYEMNELEEAKLQAYLNDSDDVLFLYILLDLSVSVLQAGGFLIYNKLVRKIQEIINSNPEARAKLRVAIGCYGKEVEERCAFVPIYDLYMDDICDDMGVTDSAKALRFAFNSTKKEIDKYKSMGKRVLRSIVFHVTDGLPTSSTEEMTEAIEEYNNYASSSGKRRIQIIAATPDKNVAKRLVYSDQTLLTEDYAGISDAIEFIASTASALSSLTTTTNPKTGEEMLNLSDSPEMIKVGSGITEVIPMEKTMSLSDILG